MTTKKALMLASVASMIDQFNIPNIRLLQSLGYKVDTAADFTMPGTITAERVEDLKRRLGEMNVGVFDVPIPRSLSPRAIRTAYKEVRRILEDGHYDLIHCHSPIGGAICRLAARTERRKGTRVIYTAHGFHFYSGAPLKNWLVYYPVEKILSRCTDVLITINREDFTRAQKSFRAGKTVYVPGIGVDADKIAEAKADGEIRRSNSIAAIRAIALLPDRFKYVIVGKGDKLEELRTLSEELGIADRVRFVGFKNNVYEYYKSADAFVFPSYREGLSAALMEAMAAGLPVACSRIRGNTDLIDEGKGGFMFDPSDREAIAESIRALFREDRGKMGRYNAEKIASSFSIRKVREEMERIYRSI